MTVERTTHWRPTDSEEAPDPVPPGEAEDAWAVAAREILTVAAGTYHALIDRTDLATQVQELSGIRSSKSPHYWLSRVLAQVASINALEGEPPLTALVVHRQTGAVGDDYDEVLRLSGAEPITDEVAREKHAAEARMECYRWAGAAMPASGGHAALSPRLDQRIVRERKRARESATPTVCPTCFMTIPPTGVCDNCD
ncbi:hypothetical protein [Nocardioides sp.]|uniref:hypothetical protein n=1 Tax=Nocardioides sp. TaxID=35761 RepID=UPI0025F63C3E|nr:hypothetical protein [Nocardioides sp.]